MTIEVPLTLSCAETHPAYLPKPRDPRWEQARLIAQKVDATKHFDPVTGERIHDHLVDSLIANTLALAKAYEPPTEPAGWTPPQRCVWRSTENKLPVNQRFAIVNDRSLCRDVKAFVSIRQARWLTLCPFPHCSGAQMASWSDRRFLCVDCLNKAVGGRWIDAVWPLNASEIERWLVHRPDYAKNWDVGETEDDLRKQDELAKVA